MIPLLLVAADWRVGVYVGRWAKNGGPGISALTLLLGVKLT
jgi:hypothetical protein